jgi:anthranilate synthase component 1
MSYTVKIRKKRFLADTITPVSAFLKLRDRYANSLLLESSDYHGDQNSYSYICCDPLAEFNCLEGKVSVRFPDSQTSNREGNPLHSLKHFRSQFEIKPSKEKYIESGLFGYINYDSVKYFEDVEITFPDDPIPEIRYGVYRFIIVFDHFRNQGFIVENYFDQPDNKQFDEIADIIKRQSNPEYTFKKVTDIQSNYSDQEFLEIVNKGIHHCHLGDVFQVVLSRKFDLGFKGDEFQVYRALRSINPSPYLFYFDYGGYKLFGSSPEAQIEINPDQAIIHPIAGTFKRTGDDKADAELANDLLINEKEDSEHIMLVDLARNDLSRHTHQVKVETYKEIQYYSHVIHLVSKVSGMIEPNTEILDIVSSTFPAGTLSGAPKVRAMELISQYENLPRGFYGGAIGFMDFDKTFNHAIMIRTFMSKGNKLHFRAGAGVVAKSDPEGEVQEVYNKVAALITAVNAAEEF